MLAIVFGPMAAGAQGLSNDGGASGNPYAPVGSDANPQTTAQSAAIGSEAPLLPPPQLNTPNSNSNSKYLIKNPLGKTTSLKQVVLNIVSIVQILLIMAAVLYLIYAGFMFVTARGEAAKITKARNALLWGIVGLALVLGAQVIITAIESSVKGIFSK